MVGAGASRSRSTLRCGELGRRRDHRVGGARRDPGTDARRARPAPRPRRLRRRAWRSVPSSPCRSPRRLDVGVARERRHAVLVLGAAVLAAIGGNVLGRWANVSMRRLHLGTVDAVARCRRRGARRTAQRVARRRPLHAVVRRVAGAADPALRGAHCVRRGDAPGAGGDRARAGVPVDRGLPRRVRRASRSPRRRASQRARRSARPTRSRARVARRSSRWWRRAAAACTRDGTVLRRRPRPRHHERARRRGRADVDVVDAGRRAVAASLVVFDPALDVAVLRVPGLSLAGAPARHGHRAARRPRAPCVGFPGGGPLSAEPAGVAGALIAQGRDVYGGGLVDPVRSTR